MSLSDKASLLLEIFYFCVKNHVTLNVIIACWNCPLVIEDLKGNSNILHLLGNGILSIDVLIGSVEAMGFLGRLRQNDPKIVGSFQVLVIPMVNDRYNSRPFFDDAMNPPIEGGYTVYSLGKGLFDNFNGV